MPRIPLPDVEAAVIGILRARLPGTHAADRLGPPWPALAATQVGGTVAKVLTAALVQVDAAGAAGSSKAAARGLIDDALEVLREAEGSTVAGVVLSSVGILAAPAYLPDGQSGAPRYVATLVVSARSAVLTA